MKIKKFENYDIDVDSDDIIEEYVKFILYKYLDSDSTIEDIFHDIIFDHELEDQESIIKNHLIEYVELLNNDVKNIRTILKKDADRYNL